jgi:hypothetical protein
MTLHRYKSEMTEDGQLNIYDVQLATTGVYRNGDIELTESLFDNMVNVHNERLAAGHSGTPLNLEHYGESVGRVVGLRRVGPDLIGDLRIKRKEVIESIEDDDLTDMSVGISWDGELFEHALLDRGTGELHRVIKPLLIEKPMESARELVTLSKQDRTGDISPKPTETEKMEENKELSELKETVSMLTKQVSELMDSKPQEDSLESLLEKHTNNTNADLLAKQEKLERDFKISTFTTALIAAGHPLSKGKTSLAMRALTEKFSKCKTDEGLDLTFEMEMRKCGDVDKGTELMALSKETFEAYPQDSNEAILSKEWEENNIGEVYGLSKKEYIEKYKDSLV